VMALGAEAVYLGTRFIATTECPAHPSYKKAIVEAVDNSTETCAGLAGVLRALKTPLVEHYVELETSGKATTDDRMRLHRSSSRAWLEGDWNEAAFPCGAGAGLIKEIKSVNEIIRSIIQDYQKTQKELNLKL
jgi:NAD(P)H-dependent flavin oxidoreductase YrpB (nitropropane dioxygenase family)